MKRFVFITVLILFSQNVFAGILIDRVVAVVDNEPITWSELYKRTAFLLSDKIANLSPEQQRKMIEKNEMQVLKTMIDNKIILMQAQKDGVYVKEEEVSQALKEIAQRNHLSLPQFEKVLQQKGISLDYYKQILKEQILIQRYETLKLKNMITVSRKEIEEYLMKKGIKKTSVETVILRQIFIPYSNNSDQIIQQALKELANGERFDEVAKQFSKGPLAATGGYLGTIKVNELSEVLRRAVERLKEGQYSKPIKTEKGIIILYLEKRLSTYEAYIKQAREELFLSKLKKIRQKWLSRLRGEHFIQILL